jgi:hypothetical protein
MWCARPARSGFSPLDEELALLPGQLTPRLQERVVRLGAWLPCRQATEALTFFTGVIVSEATVRRITEGAGTAYETGQTAAVERLEREWPPAPPGPRVQVLSVDGARVPLQHQAWAEVKTVAIGTVSAPVQERGEWVVHTEELSYCSRLADAETFGRLALAETRRRGTETAKTVCAVSDGAAWIQGFVDLHRPDAVRILDFSHAASAVARAGQAVYGEGTATFTRWFTTQRHTLRHGAPQAVFHALRQLVRTARRRKTLAAVATGQETLGYLENRQAMLAYGWCDARGYPLGSGSVESANKLVVERRLKGAGMHWARRYVNPMVALRAMACSDRWQEAWPQIAQYVRYQTQQKRHQRQLARRPTKSPMPLVPLPSAPPLTLAPTLTEHPRPSPSSKPPVHKAAKGPYRPPSDHPWRRFPISWRGAQQSKRVVCAKR